MIDMASLISKCFSSLATFPLISLLLLLTISSSSAYEFHVGGPRGWMKPTGDESETYNHWASRNRFHVGDFLYFKYENDSVVQVDQKHYKECSSTDPVAKFDDGHTTFRFDRYGFFFFISGEPGHCELGQRLIVRVMVHPGTDADSVGPSPAMLSSGGGSSSPATGSGIPAHSTSDAASMKSIVAGSVVMAVVVPGLALATVWLG